MINFRKNLLTAKSTFVQILVLFLTACNGGFFGAKENTCGEGEKKGEFKCESLTTGTESCIDPDLNFVSDKLEFTNCAGELVKGLKKTKECSKDNDSDCLTNSKFPSIDISKINPKDILKGKIIAGVTGTRNRSHMCRNMANLVYNDSSWPPSNHDNYTGVTFNPASVTTASDIITFGANHGYTTGKEVTFSSSGTLPAPLVSGQSYFVIVSTTLIIQVSASFGGAAIDITTQGTGTHTIREVGDGIADWWETVYENSSWLTPQLALSNIWGSDYNLVCDGSNFKKITSSVTMNPPTNTVPIFGTAAYTQVWEEEYTGIQFTNPLYLSVGTTTWEKAVKLCESLNKANTPESEKWYLPTQKEALLLYNSGLFMRDFDGINFEGLVTSTTDLDNGGNFISETSGYVRSTNSFFVICVR